MPLLLPFPLVGGVTAVEAAGGGSEHAVVTGKMSGSAADDGALDAALGVGSGGRQRQRGDGERSEHGSHDDVSEVDGCSLNGKAWPGFLNAGNRCGVQDAAVKLSFL